ncbi:hypothetical protein [Caballeronia zhejiangensis]|uniref:hypothetical protein n=1 Tax=Caballeronia zhejiangensis TaxID=871203 RepID=UPI001EF5D80C|nr:hypothetical protein [Caballeronia zhejiangensis]MCG7400456.1 hypothetical protein [Caballeronia zhejiangensis]
MAIVEERLEGRAMINIRPNDYVPIPSMSHRDHHALPQKFLKSDWTADMQLRRRGRDAYHAQQSIGAWHFDFKSAAVYLLAASADTSL